jgi:membrane protease YdiL (CAAX protease family)
VEPAAGAAASELTTPPHPAATAAPPRDPLSRYRGLQVASILLALGGIGAVVAATLLRSGRTDAQIPPDVALTISVLVLGGGLALVVGLLMNAVRAIVVRETLPPTRYRGPAVFVLLGLATLLTAIGSVAVARDLFALVEGNAIPNASAFVILTATQAGLVAIAIMFVAAPNALPGVRLIPERGALRSAAIGLLLAVPAWVAATVMGALLQAILGLLGHPVTPGLVDSAVARLDPTILVLAIVLVAPAAEEIFFRGVVLNAWLREYGERVAIIGSAALFAAIHADFNNPEAILTSIARVLPIFGLGLALAFVYRRTGSLLASIGLHMGFNALSIGIALAQRLGALPPF